MDKKLFYALTGALKDAAAFERREKISLRIAKLPRPQKRTSVRRNKLASKEAQ
jgi:hypothetical protein